MIAHHLKRMNLTDTDICVLCNQNSIMDSEHLFQYSSLHREREQAKDISACSGKQEEKNPITTITMQLIKFSICVGSPVNYTNRFVTQYIT